MKLSGSPPTIEVVLFAGNEIVSSVNFMFDPFTFTVISLSLNEIFCSLLFFVFVMLNPALVVICVVPSASIETFCPLRVIVLAVFDIWVPLIFTIPAPLFNSRLGDIIDILLFSNFK